MSLTFNTAYLGNVGLDQRLRVDKSGTGADIKADVHVAREGLGGRVLSWLGQLPLLRNIGAVQSHLDQVRTENREALQTFVEFLSQQYGAGAAQNVASALDWEYGGTPLTKRVIQDLTRRADADAKLHHEAESIHGSFADLRDGLAAKERIPATPTPPATPTRTEASVEAPHQPGGAALLAQLDDRLAQQEQPDYARSVQHARFKGSSVPTAAATQVGQLPVNRVAIEARPVALAGQYPGDSPQALAAHLRMLVEQGCSSLLVLAGHDQVGEGKLPPYFKDGTRDYDGVTISSKTPQGGRINLDGLNVHRYELTITVPGQEPFTLPALHVTNWSDHGTVKDAAQLEALATLARDVDAEGKALRGESVLYANVETPEALPMIHCRGGVGRTGTLIAAMELIKPDSSASLERIVADERTTRNHRMAEDQGQRQQLVELALRQGKDVLEPEAEALYVNQAALA